mmetsp:Transcript_147194/g.260197  ORF Transcript_147194/g.260197 Transcript_147194/m.260197 type:complete len:659 (+) Transcript_147194:135-2111(+)
MPQIEDLNPGEFSSCTASFLRSQLVQSNDAPTGNQFATILMKLEEINGKLNQLFQTRTYHSQGSVGSGPPAVPTPPAVLTPRNGSSGGRSPVGDMLGTSSGESLAEMSFRPVRSDRSMSSEDFMSQEIAYERRAPPAGMVLRQQHKDPTPQSKQRTPPRSPSDSEKIGRRVLEAAHEELRLGKPQPEKRFGQQWSRRSSTLSTDALEKIATTTRVGLRKASEFRQRLWALLDDPDSSRCARIIQVVMMCIILTSVLLTLVQTTEQPLIDPVKEAVIDIVFDGVFVLEVLLRFISCPNRFAFFHCFYNFIDFVCAPTLALRIVSGFTVPENQDDYTAANYVLILFVPTLRLLKLLRRSQNLRLLSHALAGALEALTLPVFLLLVICLTFSGIIYVLEPRDNIVSLPHAMWLVVVTMSTVGYGETLPVTVAGYFVTTIVVVTGVLYTALPISIVGQAWQDVWNDRYQILLTDLTRERLSQWGYTVKDLGVLFNTFDANNDGVLDLDEFSVMLSEMKLGLSVYRIRDLFDCMDDNKDCFVDQMEFTKLLFPEEYIEQTRMRKEFFRGLSLPTAPRFSQQISSSAQSDVTSSDMYSEEVNEKYTSSASLPLEVGARTVDATKVIEKVNVDAALPETDGLPTTVPESKALSLMRGNVDAMQGA